MHARRRGGAMVASALIATLMFSSPVSAAGPGPGGGGGGGGDTTGSLYADLVIALRAENGTPILQKYVVPATTETAETTEYCVQPVSYEPVPGVASRPNPVDRRTVWVIPLQGQWITQPGFPTAEFTGACDPQPQYAMFVAEVDLERLNLARTADAVIATKLADVKTKFLLATSITLESTGRISNDGTPIDASPENAAIYQSLMKTGTIPGLPESMGLPTAKIPLTAAGTGNSQFDAWELAAMTIGAAASKSTPLTLDAVEYYNRVIGFPPPADPTATPPVPEYVSPWGVSFLRSEDPENPGTQMTSGEQFVDYTNFTYNRSETFKGSVTWLDVANLKWVVNKIIDKVPFTNLGTPDATGNLHGVTAFAQLADDVRALCNFIPDNTFIPGFYMDVPGVDTTPAQLNAIVDPAVDLGTLPVNVFQTHPFAMTASLLNPWGGALIDRAQLRITVDANDAFQAGDVVANAADLQAVPFVVDNGNLVGKWGPDTGFPVAPGYNASTTFIVTVADGAPVGNYTVTLELVDLDDSATILAHETGTILVRENVATVLWGTPVPKLATQGVAMAIPLLVYSPFAGTGHLALTVTGPGDDPDTTLIEATKAGDVKIYASNGSDMVAMPLTLNLDGQLVGTWDATLVAGGSVPVTWYATVAVGALVGNYAFGVILEGGNTLDAIVVGVSAPETHDLQPPDAGEDTTAPVVTVTPVGTLGATASFDITAVDANPVTFECMLTTNSVAGPWESCTSPKTYTGLQPGTYVFSARGTDRALNVSDIVSSAPWNVADTVPPVVTITPDGTPGATATFTLSADDVDATFECMLTKDTLELFGWATCTSPKAYSDLQPGDYVFSARATDGDGNVSDVVTASWTVGAPPDTTAPIVTIGTVVTAGATATVSFTADELNVTFACQLSKGRTVIQDWASCISPKTYSGLARGTYTFSVRGTDSAGNVSVVKTVSLAIRR
ncbi:MAG: COG1361 family protein [Candidatus Limnocylindrales bacterium]